MKRLICFLISLIMVTGILTGCSTKQQALVQNNSYDKDKINVDTVNGGSRFAFDIFKQLNKEDKNQNIFISPLSISTALTMTYLGAGSTTKVAMAKTLGYTGMDDGKINDNYKNLLRYLRQLDKKIDLNISNSIWIRSGESIKADFLSANRDIFDASVTTLDFSKENAADQINQWITSATKNKISKMVDSPISSDVIMYLINAIYFKGDWTTPFDMKNTVSAQFHAGDGSTSEVMMMSRTGKVEYGQGDGYKAVRLPYGSGKVAMYCILPEESVPVNDFISKLDAGGWKDIRESIKESDDVQLQLPKFKIEYGIKNLNDSLTALGMEEAFKKNADFSGIRDDVYISRVLHKAVVEVNEKGSEAAAATSVEIKDAGAITNPPAFIADRPFVFLIADDETGAILFIGTLYKCTV